MYSFGARLPANFAIVGTYLISFCILFFIIIISLCSTTLAERTSPSRRLICQLRSHLHTLSIKPSITEITLYPKLPSTIQSTTIRTGISLITSITSISSGIFIIVVTGLSRTGLSTARNVRTINSTSTSTMMMVVYYYAMIRFLGDLSWFI